MKAGLAVDVRGVLATGRAIGRGGRLLGEEGDRSSERKDGEAAECAWRRGGAKGTNVEFIAEVRRHDAVTVSEVEAVEMGQRGAGSAYTADGVEDLRSEELGLQG